MRKVILILLFTVFCSSFSLAGNSKKITLADIEFTFFEMYEIRINSHKSWDDMNEKVNISFVEQVKSSLKRQKNRNAARCLYSPNLNEKKNCAAKVIRNLLKKSEINKKRKPGDIFYVLDAITILYPTDYPMKVTKQSFQKETYTPETGERCYTRTGDHVRYGEEFTCIKFTESFKKKLEKFKKDPSNEKVLGRGTIKYIESIKFLNTIKEKVGDKNERYISLDVKRAAGIDRNIYPAALNNYSLIGDMLNESVSNVKKNNINPELSKRRALLTKYSLILKNVKEKLDKDNFKSIDKDVSKLSKTYKTFKELEKNSNEITVNIDEAVNIIFDLNELILKSSLNSKDNEYKKLLSLASISFMQHLIDSILSIIPEKYIVETKVLKKHLFNEYDLKNIESFINVMGTNNKKFKIDELTKSADKINKYINTSDIKEKLSNLGIKNILEKEITINSTVKSAELEIRDNLSQELFKEAKSILNNLDSNELSDINKEISEVADAVASDPSFKESTSDSILDKNFGGTVTVKQLIGAARNR